MIRANDFEGGVKLSKAQHQWLMQQGGRTQDDTVIDSDGRLGIMLNTKNGVQKFYQLPPKYRLKLRKIPKGQYSNIYRAVYK